MPIQNRYQISTETGITNYNFISIMESRGYITFYGYGNSIIGEYAAPSLLDEPIEPGNVDATTSGGHERRYFFPNANPSLLTLSGSLFNFPVRVKGTAHISFTLAVTSTNTAGAYDVIADIRKNGTIQFSGSLYSMPSTASNVKTFNIPIEITTEIAYKSGDRLSIGISTGAPSGTRTVYCQMDPLNRDVSSYATSGNGTHPAITASANPTAFKAIIPFILDL